MPVKRTSKSVTSPSPKQILKKITAAIADAKGRDITVLDVSKISDITDYFIIVSGRSDRQVQGIANRILESLEPEKIHPLSSDGLEQGHWVLLDYSDVIVHVFYEPIRQEYNLEGLWATAKKVKLDSPSRPQREAA